MLNERDTEAIVRKHFENFGGEIVVEEQKSASRSIQTLLNNASKSGTGKTGKPEFVIRFNNTPDLVAVVECKASVARHESPALDQAEHFAVDGALHYAAFLARQFDVLAVGVSGVSEHELKVSHYLHLKNQDTPTQKFGSLLLSPSDYIRGYFDDPGKYRQDYESLQRFIEGLNTRLHILKVSENHRSILISAILIALERPSFRNSYGSEDEPAVLARSIVNAAIEQLKQAGVIGQRLSVVRQQFELLSTSPVLSSEKDVLREVIGDTDREVNSFIKNHKYRDVLGSLYIEFLRYANSDKGLGIILTPPHITELFVDLADVHAHSIVYDNCAGTGGFLISAMRKMIADAGGSQEQEKEIKHNRIYGVELQPNIYSLAVSNMYIHQDGKSNIELGNCFDAKVVKAMREKNPTVGFLNPPYKADKKTDTEELKFVLNNLACLQEGGTCVAILPMQSALGTGEKIKALKERLMTYHTLEAVWSMPDDLFFNSDVSVVSCIMVITAHRPHPSNKEVFLGYFKNDGFVKRRVGGRCDAEDSWKTIRENWRYLYRNHRDETGLSVCVQLGKKDEWAAEAYMKTDYSVMSDAMFEQTVRDYSAYLFTSGIYNSLTDYPVSEQDDLKLEDRDWGVFPLTELFHITGTTTTPKRKLSLYTEGEKYPYVKTTSLNNGVGGNFCHYTEQGGVLTVDSAAIGYCSYQHWNFSASDHVEKLRPLFDFDPFIALFLVTVVNLEQYRYNYGRKCSQTRMKKAEIKLPVREAGVPDFDFMRRYIEQRRFSHNLLGLDSAGEN